MHENPPATEEEQELAQTERMNEGEAMRGGPTTPKEADTQDDADAEDEPR